MRLCFDAVVHFHNCKLCQQIAVATDRSELGWSSSLLLLSERLCISSWRCRRWALGCALLAAGPWALQQQPGTRVRRFLLAAFQHGNQQ